MDSQAVEHDLKDSADGERKGCMLHAITLKGRSSLYLYRFDDNFIADRGNFTRGFFADFKSYSKAYCGPLDKFACIVGGNGAGKSVLVSLQPSGFHACLRSGATARSCLSVGMLITGRCNCIRSARDQGPRQAADCRSAQPKAEQASRLTICRGNGTFEQFLCYFLAYQISM